MADQELDELYSAKPEDFTGLRTKLAAAAKKRGDAETAKEISSARKPTTAAWVVNRLALTSEGATKRLTELGERLRAAHAEMDGDRIRQLTGEQRRLVNELTRTAVEEAELTEPSAALRDDVTGTLQAAVADPDVAARLGRLTKAERWSGFGEFGDTAMVFTATRTKTKPEPKPEPPKAAERDDEKQAARRQREEARAALVAAEQAKAEADGALSELQTDLAVARLRRDDARRRLQEAERGLTAAEDAYDKAKQASRDAANLVKQAKAQLKALK